jgi:hypothetical protein
MNYKIINDIDILDDFVYNVLPRLQDNECFYVCLFARSKYAKNEDGSNKFPHIKTDKAQLKRFIINKPEDLYRKLKQCECEVGSYKTKDNEDIPQESLAPYITVNPRNHKKALFDLSKALIKILECEGTNFNVHQEALSAIQRAKSRTVFATFDLDSKEPEHLEKVLSYVNRDAVLVLETRGGYHLLIDPVRVSSLYKKTFYNNITKLPFIDNDAGSDLMIPIPGCHQGGFTPNFKK